MKTHESYASINGRGENDFTLRKNARHTRIHDEKARFDKPNGQDLHLFHDQNKLGAINACLDLIMSEFRDVLSWFDEVTTRLHNLMHDRYQNSISRLGWD